MLASRARVGARVEVKKNDLGKVSRFIFQTNVISANYGVSGSTATVPEESLLPTTLKINVSQPPGKCSLLPLKNKQLAPPQQSQPPFSYHPFLKSAIMK